MTSTSCSFSSGSKLRKRTRSFSPLSNNCGARYTNTTLMHLPKHNLPLNIFRVSFGEGGQLPPPTPPDMLRTLFYMQAFIKALMTHVNLCLCKNSLRFHQIASNKRSKIKISRGSVPRTPLFATCFETHTCPPPIIHTILFRPPLGKNLE